MNARQRRSANETRSANSGMAVPRSILLFLLVPLARASVQTIESDEAFEATVMQDSIVWGVLFNSASKGEDSEAALGLIERLSTKMSAVQFAVADVDSVKAFASEFNVRKRMVPRLLIFNSRARQAEMVPLKDDLPAVEKLEEQVLGFLKENGKNGEHKYKKTTLAVGAPDAAKDEV